jgi:hypothetical protein
MAQSVAGMPFEASPRPVGACLAVRWRASLRLSPAGLADPWRACPPALSHVQGLGLLIPNPADGLASPFAGGPASSGASGSPPNVTFKPSPQPAGSRLPRRLLAGLPHRASLCSAGLQPGIFALDAANRLGNPVFSATENKPLRAFSNRKSNDSRKLATLSKSTTSKFLIATKMHFSEQKAKRE